MENIGLAMELLVVGMITVFTILFLVIIIGNLIIRLVNKYVPEEIVNRRPSVPGSTMNTGKIAAITGAVKTLTGGRGNVTKIEKL
ncbi:MAG: OadG family transporter subunit [Prolixibacteraceae bacterium]